MASEQAGVRVQPEVEVERGQELALLLRRPCFELAYPVGHPVLGGGELAFTAGELSRVVPVGEGHEDAGFVSFRFPRPPAGVEARVVHRVGEQETELFRGCLDALVGRGGKLGAPFGQGAVGGGLGEIWARLVHPWGLLFCEGKLRWTRDGQEVQAADLGPEAELPSDVPASGEIRARGLPAGRYAVELSVGQRRFGPGGLPWTPAPGPGTVHLQRLREAGS